MYIMEVTLKAMLANLGLGLQRRVPNTAYFFGPSGSPAARIGDCASDVTNATAGATTLTADQMFGRMYRRDCAGAARTDKLPTAALWVRALQKVPKDFSYTWLVYNIPTSSNILTIDATGVAGVTLVATAGAALTVAIGAIRSFRVTFTNVTPGSEAVEVLAT